MIMYDFKSGVITCAIVSDLMFSSAMGSNPSLFDAFLLKETGTVISTCRIRKNNLLVAKGKPMSIHIASILNDHPQFCQHVLGFYE